MAKNVKRRRVRSKGTGEHLEKLIAENPKMIMWLILLLIGLLIGYMIQANEAKESFTVMASLILTIVGGIGFFKSVFEVYNKKYR